MPGLMQSASLPGTLSLEDIMRQQKQQDLYANLLRMGTGMMASGAQGGGIGHGLMAGLSQFQPPSQGNSLETYATYQGIQDAQRKREQDEAQRNAFEELISPPAPQYASAAAGSPHPVTGGGILGTGGGLMAQNTITPEERRLAVAMGPKAYMAAKAKDYFSTSKDPLIKEFKEGDEIITKRYNRSTGEWEGMARGDRYKPPETKVEVTVGDKLPKPPTGYYYPNADPANPQLAPIPGWTGPDEVKRKAALDVVGRMESSLDRYQSVLEKSGTEIMPGEAKMLLGSAYNDVILEAKELFNLGVLNGPDLTLMQQYLRDPTTVSSRALEGVAGIKPFLSQIEQAREKLNAARARAEGLYGRKADKLPKSTTRFKWNPETDELEAVD